MLEAMGSTHWSRIMKTWTSMALLIACLQGCATQLTPGPGSAPEDAETASAAPKLRFQHFSIAPNGDEAFVSADALQPGDILLTAIPSLTSVGIRVMSFGAVSHAAVYIGEGKVVEAVGSGVRVRGIDELLEEESVVLALRYPDLSAEQAQRIGDYALTKLGTGFNYVGVTLHVPLSISRRLCELPLVPSAVRDACIRGMGVINQVAVSESQLFCSQLVAQAYRQAGVPMTDADPRLVSPVDILHMREGDVSSVSIRKPLHYAGHLKYQQGALALALQR
jgi:uncharacterized protein YycO